MAINRGEHEASSDSGSSLACLWRYWSFDDSQRNIPKKPVLAPIKTSSRLEARRHLLAGRRRTKRIEDAQKGEARDGVSIEVKKKVREEVLQLLIEKDDNNEQESGPQAEAEFAKQQRRLKAVEIEFMIRSYLRQEDGIKVKDGRVEVDIPGDEPFSHPEEEIRRTAAALGVSLPGDSQYQMGRRLSADFFAAAWMPATSPTLEVTPSAPRSDLLEVGSTLTTTMHLVFPQHTNSQSIIFGGNTMSWSEDVALMACRNIAVNGVRSEQRGNWKTVAMDGLEFNVRVAVGE